MPKAREGDKCYQYQRYLYLDPVIGSRELKGEAAKGRIGFGVTSEIYLLEHVLQLGAAMVTSELR